MYDSSRLNPPHDSLGLDHKSVCGRFICVGHIPEFSLFAQDNVAPEPPQ